MKLTGSGGVRVSALAAKKADDMVEARRQLTLYKLLETERNSVEAGLIGTRVREKVQVPKTTELL